jgi:hypothetical protein
MVDRPVTCPLCGTAYLVTCEVGFGENDIELRRTSPTAVGAAVAPDSIDGWRRDLTSPLADTRDHAVVCLLDYFNAVGDTLAVLDLLAHPNPAIRLAAILRIRSYADPGPYASAMIERFKDRGPDIPANAVPILGQFPDLFRGHSDELRRALPDVPPWIRSEIEQFLSRWAGG